MVLVVLQKMPINYSMIFFFTGGLGCIGTYIIDGVSGLGEGSLSSGFILTVAFADMLCRFCLQFPILFYFNLVCGRRGARWFGFFSTIVKKLFVGMLCQAGGTW